MVKWEYFTLYIDGNGLVLNQTKMPKVQLSPILNDVGKDGWECFHVEGNLSIGFMFLFKRPMEVNNDVPNV